MNADEAPNLVVCPSHETEVMVFCPQCVREMSAALMRQLAEALDALREVDLAFEDDDARWVKFWRERHARILESARGLK